MEPKKITRRNSRQKNTARSIWIRTLPILLISPSTTTAAGMVPAAVNFKPLSFGAPMDWRFRQHHSSFDRIVDYDREAYRNTPLFFQLFPVFIAFLLLLVVAVDKFTPKRKTDHPKPPITSAVNTTLKTKVQAERTSPRNGKAR